MRTENYITSYFIANKKTLSINGAADFPELIDENLDTFCKGLYQKFEIKYSKFHKMDRLSKLAFISAEILLRNTNITTRFSGNDIGVVLSNNNSSLDTDIRFQESTNDLASPALFVYTLPNIMIGEICIRNKTMGENAFFIFEQYDWNFMCSYVNNLINNGDIKACIMGWVDVLKDDFESILFLVEKESNEVNLACNAEVIEDLYKKVNGKNGSIN